MQIDVNNIRNTTDSVGKIYWICDYRRPDISKKALRHVPPTQAIVVDNATSTKRFYYSEVHFAKLTAKGLASSTTYPIFDNTGFRSNTGTPLLVFDNKEECVQRYNELADVIIARLEQEIKHAVDNLNREKQEVLIHKAHSLSL